MPSAALVIALSLCWWILSSSNWSVDARLRSRNYTFRCRFGLTGKVWVTRVSGCEPSDAKTGEHENRSAGTSSQKGKRMRREKGFLVRVIVSNDRFLVDWKQ